MKRANLLLFTSILVVFGAILFYSRQIFHYRYEPEYYENYYYHSQWNYPGSTRGISDGELYKFVGYRLAEGENPFNINYETPPLAKYLYGLAEKAVGNPYWVSLIVYLLSAMVLFKLSKDLFKEKEIPLLTVFLFVTTPFVATQIKETMLDLPLMFMFLVHLWQFIKYLKSRKLLNLIFSGIFLGLATGVKLGVYTPLAAVLGLVLVILTQKKIMPLIYYFGSIIFGYVLSFFCYFIRHPNPIPWLRLHEKPIGFYLDSWSRADYLNQWRGIFANTYQGWWLTGHTGTFGDWSLVLPLGVLAMILVIKRAIQSKSKEWLYASLLCLIFLLVNSFIQFWPRYLMPVIPLFILFIAYVFRKYSFIILLVAVLNLPFLAGRIKPGNVLGDAQAASRFISTRAYRELYRSIDPEERQVLSEEVFIAQYEYFLESIETRKVEARAEEVIDEANKKAKVKFKIIYSTKYGEASHEPVFEFTLVNNQWKLNWKWDYLWPGYKLDSKIVVKEKPVPFQRLKDKEGRLIASRSVGCTVYVIPRLMFDWNKYIDALSKATNQTGSEVNERIRSVVPDRYPRYVGYLSPAYGLKEKNELLSLAGVSIKEISFLAFEKNIFSNRPVSVPEALILVKEALLNNPDLFMVPAEVNVEYNGKKIPIPFTQSYQNNGIIKL